MAKQKVTLGDNSTEIDSLTQDEVKGIVDASLDEKLGKLEIPETFDADAFKKDILGEVTSLFEKHQTPAMDEDAFLKKMDKLFDNKLSNALKGFGNGKTERQPGFLSKYLST